MFMNDPKVNFLEVKYFRNVKFSTTIPQSAYFKRVSFSIKTFLFPLTFHLKTAAGSNLTFEKFMANYWLLQIPVQQIRRLFQPQKVFKNNCRITTHI